MRIFFYWTSELKIVNRSYETWIIKNIWYQDLQKRGLSWSLSLHFIRRFIKPCDIKYLTGSLETRSHLISRQVNEGRMSLFFEKRLILFGYRGALFDLVLLSLLLLQQNRLKFLAMRKNCAEVLMYASKSEGEKPANVITEASLQNQLFLPLKNL